MKKMMDYLDRTVIGVRISYTFQIQEDMRLLSYELQSWGEITSGSRGKSQEIKAECGYG